MIVIDASVAVKWFVAEEGHMFALSLLEQNKALIAPDLIFSETTNVFWKKQRKGEMTTAQSEEACRALPDFLHRVVGVIHLNIDALRFATQLGHSVYDCIYLACAERTGAKLVTADKKFLSRIRNFGLGHLAMDLNESAELGAATEARSLSISDAELARVVGLSDRFRQTMEFVEKQVSRPVGEGTLKWINTKDLTPALHSPIRRRLSQTLSDLSPDELSDVVALAWLGRGNDGHDWSRLRRSAENLLGQEPLEYEGYIISLLGYVRNGLLILDNLRGAKPDQSTPATK